MTRPFGDDTAQIPGIDVSRITSASGDQNVWLPTEAALQLSIELADAERTTPESLNDARAFQSGRG